MSTSSSSSSSVSPSGFGASLAQVVTPAGEESGMNVEDEIDAIVVSLSQKQISMLEAEPNAEVRGTKKKIYLARGKMKVLKNRIRVYEGLVKKWTSQVSGSRTTGRLLAALRN